VNNDEALIHFVVKRWQRFLPEELRSLENQRQNFLTTEKSQAPWLHALRKGLGITTSALAEKLGTNRSGVLQYEKSEAQGQITIQSLQAWADALDCEFIYEFKPKNQPTFSHLIVSRTIPFLDDKFLQYLNHLPDQKSRAIYSRMTRFLAHKTGWSKIWGHRDILNNSNFNWFIAKRRMHY
jgi:transcriptional regulator with XRE-family HTH domain